MASAAVIDFFERFSDGWLFDATHLKKLWAAFRKDKDAAGAQLANCLLVYVSAPEKHESDKFVPRCLREWAGFMPVDAEWKSWGEDIIGSLLAQLAKWIPQAAKHSRVRVLNLISELLRGLRPETMLAEDVRKAVVESLREHLPDKDDKVRQRVVVLLTKFGFPEEDDNGTDVPDLVSELTEALHSDISQDVRSEVVIRLPLNQETLVEVLRHQSDRSAKVAAAVYDKVASGVPLAQPAQPADVTVSADLHRSLLWYGLHEPREEVRSAAQDLLAKWFKEDAAGDVVPLLEAFGPQTHGELCLLILEQLMAKELWDPQEWLKAETAANRSAQALWRVAEHFEKQQQQNGGAGGSAAGAGAWLTGVSPALVFVWVFATRKVEEVALDKGRAAAEKVGAVVAQVEASAGAQAEMALESFLPTAQEMARLCLLAAEAGPSNRFIAAQLLEVSTLSYMTWVDASSREAAEATLRALVTRISRPEGAELHDRRPDSPFLLAADGGSGAWETAVLRFAAAIYGHDGAALVAGVLPMVLQLVGQGADECVTDVAEALLVEVLTYLHLLMAAAGPSVPPSTSTSGNQLPAHLGGAAGGSCGDESDGNEFSWSLARAVNRLAWHASGHPSPAVRTAAVRCCVELCQRDGGLAQLPRTVAFLAPMLPAAAAGGNAMYGSGPGNEHDDDKELIAQQQRLRRIALQGLVDLAITWGEPTLTVELQKAVAAAAGLHRVDDVTAQMAALGVDANGNDEGAGPGDATAGGPGVEAAAQGVAPILLRLTEGVVRKLQVSSGYVPARGMVADALLGSARLVHGCSFQLRLNKRLRHQVVTATQPRVAEQLLTRLLLARFSPSLESEPWMRSQLSAFFKSFQEAASAASEEGAVYRSMLAGAFLHAARCAMALPAPAGAPSTARGCAAPALMEFAGELLASASISAIAATAEATEDADDEIVSAERAPEVAVDAAAATAAVSEDPCVILCELVLEELVRLGSPGSASLDTGAGPVRAYATELCKTPMRLFPGLPVGAAASSSATLHVIRRLAYLGRRAVLTAGESLVKQVVPDTAYKKLQEFVRELEELQHVKTAPLSDADAKKLLEALREQLKDRLAELPSLEDVTADLIPDDEWDILTTGSQLTALASAATAAGGEPVAARKRGPAAKGSKGGGGAGKGRGGTATRTRQHGKTSSASRGGVRGGRRSDTRNSMDADSDSDGDSDEHQGNDDDSECGDTTRRPTASGVAKGAKGSMRPPSATRSATSTHPTASQDTTTTSDVGSQPGRRSTRAAAAKASERLEALRANRGG